jgi:rubrerythrin
MNFKNTDEALDFAIKNEEEAYQFYTDLAANAANASLRKTLVEFAQEEKGHKAKLEAVKSGKKMISAEAKVMDLKIGDYLLDAEPTPNMPYQEALILAMKAEKRAYKLYTNLAATTDEPHIKKLFEALAQEEAKHKLRFEIEYDEQIMSEN